MHRILKVHQSADDHSADEGQIAIFDNKNARNTTETDCSEIMQVDMTHDHSWSARSKSVVFSHRLRFSLQHLSYSPVISYDYHDGE